MFRRSSNIKKAQLSPHLLHRDVGYICSLSRGKNNSMRDHQITYNPSCQAATYTFVSEPQWFWIIRVPRRAIGILWRWQRQLFSQNNCSSLSGSRQENFFSTEEYFFTDQRAVNSTEGFSWWKRRFCSSPNWIWVLLLCHMFFDDLKLACDRRMVRPIICQVLFDSEFSKQWPRSNSQMVLWNKPFANVY